MNQVFSTSSALPEPIRGERTSEVYLMDCMEGMAKFPDKWFDLAVVDPPYGVGNWVQITGKKSKTSKEVTWNDYVPDASYFREIIRVSKHQIIWGWNYYTMHLPATNSLIFWNKRMGSPTYSAGELAYTSFNHPLLYIEIPLLSQGTGDRVHPCQKPIAVYDWIYNKFIPEGGKVIDTHLGSGSNRIAAHKAGNIDFTGYEIDKDYYEAQEARWKAYISQTRLF